MSYGVKNVFFSSTPSFMLKNIIRTYNTKVLYGNISSNNSSNYVKWCVVHSSKFQLRCYAMKSDLKIKWVRPPKISCINPKKSGDLQPIHGVDLKQFPVDYQNCEELQTADDQVKKLFSLEFSPRNKAMHLVRTNMLESVRRHPLDRGSMEARIAHMTGVIRDLQNHMEQHPRDKVNKVKLKELIDKRKKFLKFLRRWDYKRFEWLLEKLDLEYHPPPEHFHWITRKDSLRKLTNKYCEDLKQERLASYKRNLEAQKEVFLKEKASKLKWIIEEERACGINPTITQDEIDQVLRQLENLNVGKGKSKESRE